MKNRPISIAIISWFLIVTAFISLVASVWAYGNPDVVKMMEMNVLPVSVQYTLTAVGVVLSILCGVLMLKARQSGRTVYVGWTLLSLAIGLFTAPAKMMLLPGLIFFLIIAFFLFRPKANEYFSQGQEGLPSDS